MGSQKWNRAGQYGAAGAAAGAAVGSVVPVIGTAIGGAVGAVGGAIGGFIGGYIEDENDASAHENAMAEAEREKARAKKDAFSQFMSQEAMRLGANPTLAGYAGMKRNQANIDRVGAQRAAQMQQQYEDATAYDPATTVQLGTALAGVGQNVYKAANYTPPAAPAGGGGGIPTPADLSKIPPPQYTPSKIQDPALSPEVQLQFDEENLKPLRQGRRVGWGQS